MRRGDVEPAYAVTFAVDVGGDDIRIGATAQSALAVATVKADRARGAPRRRLVDRRQPPRPDHRGALTGGALTGGALTGGAVARG